MRKILLIFVLLCNLSGLTLAQETRKRPKLGIALSGGGAKGFSHIGVLKVMEEAGLVPDYLTGTSMGSIVGGLYALGYPADSLEAITRRQDWNRVLTDNLPLPEVIFEEKQYFKNQLIELPFIDGQVKPPGGLIQGQEIEHLLANLTLPAYATEDFNQLPTPFHAMAVDLYWGVPVELTAGSLAEAIRASMAIPSVFTPVRRDSLILVDGGLIRNFPVQELREMGADIVIGVHCGPRRASMEELEGLTGIIPQAMFLGSVQDSEAQMEYLDLYVEPDIDPYGAPDFASADSIMARGEAEGRRHFQAFQRLADSLNALGPPPARPLLRYPEKLFIDSIEVKGNSIISDDAILGWANIDAGTAIAPNALDQAIDNLYGTNYFIKIKYSLRRENNRNILTFEAVERANALIKGSLIYDTYHNVGLAFNFTLRNLLGANSRLMFVGKLATNYRYSLSYLKYLNEDQNLYLDASVHFNRDQLPVIQEGRPVQEISLQDLPVDLLLYKRLQKNLRFGIGVGWESLSLKSAVGEAPVFDRLNYNNLNLIGSLELNSLNSNILPSSGTHLRFEARFVNNLGYSVNGLDTAFSNPDSLFGFDNYPKLSFHSDSYLPLGERVSLRLSPFAGILWGAGNTYSDFFLMGSPERVSRRSIPFFGLDPNEFAAQVSLGTGIGLQYFLWDNLILAADFNAGFFAEPEVGNGIPNPDRFLAGAGLTAGYNSILGPVKLSVMLPFNTDGAIQDKLKVFLSIGHRF